MSSSASGALAAAGRPTPSRRAAAADAGARGNASSKERPVMDVPGAERSLHPRRRRSGLRGARSREPAVRAGQQAWNHELLRDAWHQAQDPYGFAGAATGQMPRRPAPARRRARTAAAARDTVAARPGVQRPPPETGSYAGGPPLPEGYYSLNGPPPPGYFDAPPAPGVIAACRPGCATAGRANSTDALARPAMPARG